MYSRQPIFRTSWVLTKRPNKKAVRKICGLQNFTLLSLSGLKIVTKSTLYHVARAGDHVRLHSLQRHLLTRWKYKKRGP